MQEKTWIELSRSALTHNFRILKRFSFPAVPIACIKGNAYGHGLAEVASVLDRSGAKWFGVDWWKDAVWLRKEGYRQKILVLGFIPPENVTEVVRAGVSFVVYTKEGLSAALKSASSSRPALMHLEVETGFTRQGIDPVDLDGFLKAVKSSKGRLILEGVSTHFANVEDVSDQRYAQKQLAAFRKVVALVKEYGFDSTLFHTASSAATLLFPEARYDLTRPGLSLFGLWPSDRTRDTIRHVDRKLDLKPVLAWKARIAQVKRVKKGTPVSYGLTERVKRDSVVVVIPAGYFDGLDRTRLSRRGHILIGGRRCKILGRVCMNMCMVDATDVDRIRVGDEAVLIGRQRNEQITAEELADLCGTINYEIVTKLSALLPRKIVL